MGGVCGAGLFENRWVRFAYPPYAALTVIIVGRVSEAHPPSPRSPSML